MRTHRHLTRSKAVATHRRMPLAEEFGLHAAVLLLALGTALVRIAG
jgi:hypothetical protein